MSIICIALDFKYVFGKYSIFGVSFLSLFFKEMY
jgi:hypothetical protein